MAYQGSSRGRRTGEPGRGRQGQRTGGRPDPRGGGRPNQRAGGRPPPRGGRGKSSNATPMIIAGIALVGVVAVIAILASKGDEPVAQPWRSTEPTGDAPPPTDATPAKKTVERPPPPPLEDGLRERATTLAKELAAEIERAKHIYDAGMAAKAAGDDALWQQKLRETKKIIDDVQYRWNNDIIYVIHDSIGDNEHWNAEEIANHYLGREGQKVAEGSKLKIAIEKQIRMD